MKIYRLYVLLASTCLSAVAVVVLLAYNNHAVAVSPTPSDATDPTTVSTTQNNGYILGEWNGKLALYTAGNPYPQEVYDVFVRSFPQEEQRRLSEGIHIATEAELEALLEDYSG